MIVLSSLLTVTDVVFTMQLYIIEYKNNLVFIIFHSPFEVIKDQIMENL